MQVALYFLSPMLHGRKHPVKQAQPLMLCGKTRMGVEFRV